MKKMITLVVAVVFSTLLYADHTQILRVTVPSDTRICNAVGKFCDWKLETMYPMALMSTSENQKVFQTVIIVPEDVSDNEYRFKFLAGKNWDYEQVESSDFYYRDGYDVSVSGFKKISTHTKSIVARVPNNVQILYFTGSYNDWKINDAMTYCGDDGDMRIYCINLPTEGTDNLEFKLVAGKNWAYEQTESTNSVFAELDTDGDGVAFVTCTSFKAVYDPSPAATGNVTVNIVSTPAGTDEVWLVGSWGNGWWLSEGIQCVSTGSGTFQGIIPNVNIAEFKCFNRVQMGGEDTWEYEEAIDEAGTSLPANRVANYTSQPIMEISIAYWKNKAYKTEGLSENEMMQPEQKIIRDGQLLIIRNGNCYTATGIQIQ